jgi:hypothetical protein
MWKTLKDKTAEAHTLGKSFLHGFCGSTDDSTDENPVGTFFASSSDLFAQNPQQNANTLRHSFPRSNSFQHGRGSAFGRVSSTSSLPNSNSLHDRRHSTSAFEPVQISSSFTKHPNHKSDCSLSLMSIMSSEDASSTCESVTSKHSAALSHKAQLKMKEKKRQSRRRKQQETQPQPSENVAKDPSSLSSELILINTKTIQKSLPAVTEKVKRKSITIISPSSNNSSTSNNIQPVTLPSSTVVPISTTPTFEVNFEDEFPMDETESSFDFGGGGGGGVTSQRYGSSTTMDYSSSFTNFPKSNTVKSEDNNGYLKFRSHYHSNNNSSNNNNNNNKAMRSLDDDNCLLPFIAENVKDDDDTFDRISKPTSPPMMRQQPYYTMADDTPAPRGHHARRSSKTPPNTSMPWDRVETPKSLEKALQCGVSPGSIDSCSYSRSGQSNNTTLSTSFSANRSVTSSVAADGEVKEMMRRSYRREKYGDHGDGNLSIISSDTTSTTLSMYHPLYSGQAPLRDGANMPSERFFAGKESVEPQSQCSLSSGSSYVLMNGTKGVRPPSVNTKSPLTVCSKNSTGFHYEDLPSVDGNRCETPSSYASGGNSSMPPPPRDRKSPGDMVLYSKLGSDKKVSTTSSSKSSSSSSRSRTKREKNEYQKIHSVKLTDRTPPSTPTQFHALSPSGSNSYAGTPKSPPNFSGFQQPSYDPQYLNQYTKPKILRPAVLGNSEVVWPHQQQQQQQHSSSSPELSSRIITPEKFDFDAFR